MLDEKGKRCIFLKVYLDEKVYEYVHDDLAYEAFLRENNKEGLDIDHVTEDFYKLYKDLKKAETLEIKALEDLDESSCLIRGFITYCEFMKADHNHIIKGDDFVKRYLENLLESSKKLINKIESA